MGLLEAKLKSCINLCPAQRGFIKANGCYENTIILHEVIKDMKEVSGGSSIQIDVSKAFDTVPHDAISPALTSKGVHPVIAVYIVGSYADASTMLQINKEEIPIHIKRGVKQGDPLSPLLFNAIIDPILDTLSKHEYAYEMAGQKVGVLGFADDVIILAKVNIGATKMFEILVGPLDRLRMNISISKCGAS